MVVYMRDKDCAECVELPILSNHAFISYASVLSNSPPYKVSSPQFIAYSRLSREVVLDSL